MQACKSVLMVLCAAAAVSATGCATDKSTGTSDEQRLIEAVETAGGQYIGEIPQSSLPSKGGISDANGNGQCCWGHCTSSNAFENVSLPSGCRDWVVGVCHDAHQAFNPNGDAWWGTCL